MTVMSNLAYMDARGDFWITWSSCAKTIEIRDFGDIIHARKEPVNESHMIDVWVSDTRV